MAAVEEGDALTLCQRCLWARLRRGPCPGLSGGDWAADGT